MEQYFITSRLANKPVRILVTIHWLRCALGCLLSSIPSKTKSPRVGLDPSTTHPTSGNIMYNIPMRNGHRLADSRLTRWSCQGERNRSSILDLACGLYDARLC